MKKFVWLCIMLVLTVFPCIARTPGWQLVAGGDPVAPPVRTDYGFAMLLDGRTLAAVSSSGVLLWESGVPGGKPDPFIGKGSGGFLLTVSGRKNLTLFNPSGLSLWTVEVPAEIISAPIQGRDGRIFVQCHQKIACYGSGGTLKWTADAGAAATFPLIQLEDGSVLHIQQKTISGCSTALRISPFGVILEEITFTGKITAAAETDYGALLLFTDGSAGCCSATENGTVSRWVIPADTLSVGANSTLLTERGSNTAAIVSPNSGAATIVFLNTKSGEIISRQNAKVNAGNLAFSVLDGESVIICDSKNAGEYSMLDETIWESPVPSNKRWSYLLYTDNGYLVLLEKNTWVVSAYRMTQKIGMAKKKTAQKNTDKNIGYRHFTDEAAKKAGLSSMTSELFGKTIPQEMFKAMTEQLPMGGYSEHEATWIAAVSLESTQLTNRFMRGGTSNITTTLVDSDMAYYQQVIQLMGYFECNVFNKTLSSIIQKEAESALLVTALQTVARIAYDPDGLLLDSIQRLMYRQSTTSNQRMVQGMCDAVYEICRYMGRPAIFSKGRQILSYMLNLSADNRARAYTAVTMERIIALQM